MRHSNQIIRHPDGYRGPGSQRNIRKRSEVINLFDEERISDLKQIHRSGSRGRILSALVLDLFDMLRVNYQAEPLFNGIEPSHWYVHFANENDIELKVHDFYNPDFVLADGTWVEITLSENTAYKKLFRYGHQANKLIVYWLDDDKGHHSIMART